jgi:glutamate synthase (NADPH/NADH) small chain
MTNLQNKKTPMRRQTPKNAVSNFDEVNLGYNYEEAINEASRCLNCKDHPCVNACPLHNNIPLLNQMVVDGKFNEAYKISIENNPLAGICGRICQQEDLCEKACIRGKKVENDPVAIGNIERFLSDYHSKYGEKDEIKKPSSKAKRVAIIGSGPAGLSCAFILNRNGINVDVYEKKNKFGGLLRYGIPSFVLSRDIIDERVELLKKSGVKFHASEGISENFNLENLLKKEGYSAVFVANGANEPRKMGIPNEDAYGSYDSRTYLSLNNAHRVLMKIKNKELLTAEHVVVVGGGNVAIDVDRLAIRNGAHDVHNLYRRSEKEMPARREEYNNAISEGVIFDFLCNPVDLIVDPDTKRIKSVVVQRMMLGEPDASGRRSPVPIKGNQFTIPCDLIIFALGATSDVSFANLAEKLSFDQKGLIVINKETCETSIPHVYAGGDTVLGASFAVYAIDQGKRAALSIIKDLNE